jgi:hypothetical protein
MNQGECRETSPLSGDREERGMNRLVSVGRIRWWSSQRAVTLPLIVTGGQEPHGRPK